MKLCFICSCNEGGFGSFTKNLFSVLLQQGHEVSIISLNGNYDIGLQIPQKVICVSEKAKKSDYHKISWLNFKYYSTRAIHKIFKKSYDYRYIKLFNHQLSCYYKILNHKEKYDLSEYDAVISTEEILCNYFLVNNVIAKRKIGFIHPDYKGAHFAKCVDKPMLKKLYYVCTVSHATAETLKKCIPSIKDKVVGIPNVIDVSRILELAKEKIYIEIDHNQLNLITVCRLDNTSKALDRLLLLCKKMNEEHFNFVWRIVGDGYYRKTMEDFIKNNDLQDKVILLGHKVNPIPYLKASDLFVLQSYYEGYPISVCEALISDIPCLITDFPASVELVLNNVNGFIVENNFDSIYGKISYVYNNKRLLDKMSLFLKTDNKFHFQDTEHLTNICKENL